MKTTLDSWSISKLFVFEECKYRAKLQWLDKVPDTQPRPAADRGTQIHLEAEEYICGRGELTHGLRHFADDLEALRLAYSNGKVTCEDEWGFDKNWQPTEWKSAWLRLKADATCLLSDDHISVVDFKTGKRFGNELKHARQLQLYAVCALILHAQVKKVTCELWYFDQNEMADFTMHRKQLGKYLNIFNKAGLEFTSETQFPASPNIFSCKYCPYSPSKQGDCQYGVDVDNPFNRPEPQPANAASLPPLDDPELEAFRRRI